MGKVIIIGLDGATFDLIKPWVNDGKLPCLANLMKNGVWGNLMSLIPSMSGPAWVSFMTGKNPGKHGVLGFVDYTPGTYPGERQPSLVSSLAFRDKTLWEILSSNGKSVGVMNVPITYPPKKVNGFLISDFTTPLSAKVFTYPQELAQVIPDYRIGVRRRWQGEDAKSTITELRDELIIKEYHDNAARRTSVALRLLKQWAPNFFIIVFKGTDEMQHFFWGRENILLEYYQKIDKNIDRILAQGGKDADVFIISDHGFGPAATRGISANAWLEQVGLLKTEAALHSGLFRTVYHLVRDIQGRTRFKKRLPSRSIAVARRVASPSVVWDQTKAYGRNLPHIAGININLRGREPRGIVEPGQEYEELRKEIIANLRRLTDPESGDTVMAEIYSNKEIYWGANLDKTPDIIGVPKHKYSVFPDFFAFTKSTFAALFPRLQGEHFTWPNGILVAYGPHIKGGEAIEGARLIDIAPTILHMMRLPVPKDMDGRVLKELFKEDSEAAQRQVKYQQLDVERDRVESKITDLKRLGRI